MKLVKEELTYLVTFYFRHLMCSPCESGFGFFYLWHDSIHFTWNLMGVREHGKYLFLIRSLSPTVFKKKWAHPYPYHYLYLKRKKGVRNDHWENIC